MSDNKKLAVVFPGIGYHKDKPLLYYASKLVKSKGYEVIDIEYHDLPHKIRGDKAMMREAAELAYAQTVKSLYGAKIDAYEDIVFIGKSIGTVILAKYAAEHHINARQILYTPVEATFNYASSQAIAFIGDADPWSVLADVERMAKEKNIPLHIYPDCNHSLECEDVNENIEILHDVIRKTEEYLWGIY